ncbi:Hypothetical predicted protein [Octopus vulgaris]|uniref:Uncharacterized protein n=1 Tax=Octopus vulgaris TaxID=6645 RepID=A0AA36ARB2_OCTVU|nr:Hypothetical predicted protein [Octopus vulgaris]
MPSEALLMPTSGDITANMNKDQLLNAFSLFRRCIEAAAKADGGFNEIPSIILKMFLRRGENFEKRNL